MRRYALGDRSALAMLALAVISAAACDSKPLPANANRPPAIAPASNAGNANASPPASSSPGAAIDIKTPDRFSLEMTISAEQIDSDSEKMPTLQFTLSQFDADRRWAFLLPSVGHVVFLEKSGLRYLVLSDRKEYLEVNPGELGVQLERELTPGAIAADVTAGARVELLGVEPVNGRTARKYRFKTAGDGSKGDGVLYVDIETGLPVRLEVAVHPSTGKGLRAIAETRDIQLNPDRTMFDVPVGMKKISSQDAKQSVAVVASVLRSFAGMMKGSLPPAASVTGPGANKNAARPGR